jgi:hypothetical protein
MIGAKSDFTVSYPAPPVPETPIACTRFLLDRTTTARDHVATLSGHAS